MRIPGKRLDHILLIGYVALLYAILPVTPLITRPIESAFPSVFGAFGNTAVIVFLLVGFAVFKDRLKKKPPAVWAGIAVILLIYAFLLIFNTPIAVEKLHLIEYGFLTYLVVRVVKDVRPQDRKYLYVVFTVTIIGICDELIQKLLPNRVCDVRDMMMNSLAGMLALVLLVLLDEA